MNVITSAVNKKFIINKIKCFILMAQLDLKKINKIY